MLRTGSKVFLTWEIDLHREKGDALPVTTADRYVRVPTLALLFLGPVTGFFFVSFLRLIASALVARELGHRMSGWSGRKTVAEAKANHPDR